jgi:hypothetical protein
MPASAAKPASRNFTLTAISLIAVTVFFGFSFTIVPDLLARLRPVILYVHTLTAAAWLLLLVMQVTLVRNRNVVLHRKIGGAGLWLGAVASVTALATSLVLSHDSVVRDGPDRIPLLSLPLATFLLFTVALGLGAYWRKRPALHRRCMILAPVPLLIPALARTPLVNTIPHVTEWVPALVILIFCAQDYRTSGRVHPIYAAGFLLTVLVQQAAAYLAVQHPAYWVAAARVLIGV